MIFKSISNAAFEVTGFFALYKECILHVLKILLTEFYLPLITTLKPCVYSHTNYTLAPTFGYSCHTVRMPSHQPITWNPEQTQNCTTFGHCYEENQQNNMQTYVHKNKSLSLTHDLTPGLLLSIQSILLSMMERWV